MYITSYLLRLDIYVASYADILLACHAIFPPQRWAGKIVWRDKKMSAQVATYMCIMRLTAVYLVCCLCSFTVEANKLKRKNKYKRMSLFHEILTSLCKRGFALQYQATTQHK